MRGRPIRAEFRTTKPEAPERSGQTHGGCRSGRTKDLVAETLRRQRVGEGGVAVVGDARRRANRADGAPGQRGRAWTKRSRAPTITRFKRGSRGGVGIRRRILRVVVGARAGPVRISRTHHLLGVVTTRLLRPRLPGRLHEEPYRPTLQQHRPGKHERDETCPSGQLEWKRSRPHDIQDLGNIHHFLCGPGSADRETASKPR